MGRVPFQKIPPLFKRGDFLIIREWRISSVRNRRVWHRRIWHRRIWEIRARPYKCAAKQASEKTTQKRSGKKWGTSRVMCMRIHQMTSSLSILSVCIPALPDWALRRCWLLPVLFLAPLFPQNQQKRYNRKNHLCREVKENRHHFDALVDMFRIRGRNHR